MFVDEVVVELKAGKGGDGSISFLREKFMPKGGPDGGDGGKGGDVILLCDENLSDLSPYRYKAHAKAQNGEYGRGKDQFGKGGDDCTVRVPVGTIITREATQELECELTVHGQTYLLLKGGKGGKGNLNFKSSIDQTPYRSTPGWPGDEGKFRFLLKTVADIGLVGFPNAGKSSLTTQLTHSPTKAAPYPFTTLNPHVGVIEYPETYEFLLLADIPGLIEGASQNKGLGHRFLRHIERCTLLAFIVDMACEDGRDALKDYAQLVEELRLYNPVLLDKQHIIIANKMDLPNSEQNLKRFKKKVSLPIFPISCRNQEGLEALKTEFYKASSTRRMHT